MRLCEDMNDDSDPEYAFPNLEIQNMSQSIDNDSSKSFKSEVEMPSRSSINPTDSSGPKSVTPKGNTKENCPVMKEDQDNQPLPPISQINSQEQVLE